MKTNTSYKKMSMAMALIGMLMMAMFGLSSIVAAEPNALVVEDWGDPLANIWLILALISFVVMFIFIFLGYAEKSESTRLYGMALGSLIVAGLFVAIAMFTPAPAADGAPGAAVTVVTKYNLILNPANSTTLGTAYGDDLYYTWKDVQVNTTANGIANGTEALTFNVTISRIAGSIDDRITCYISSSDIPQSELGYNIVAKNSGVFAITWTPDTGGAVTGLSELPMTFEGATQSTRYATCAITLSDAAFNDLANEGEESTGLTMTFMSEQAGLIGTVDIDIDLNAWA